VGWEGFHAGEPQLRNHHANRTQFGKFGSEKKTCQEKGGSDYQLRGTEPARGRNGKGNKHEQQ